VRFTVDDAITVLNGGLADGLSQMTLACTRRTQIIVLTF
jgi:hypothetical protein